MYLLSLLYAPSDLYIVWHGILIVSGLNWGVYSITIRNKWIAEADYFICAKFDFYFESIRIAARMKVTNDELSAFVFYKKKLFSKYIL
jgi:hypothetical protein